MELSESPFSPSASRPSIQGDPATYRFGLFLLGTLAVVTIGAIVGIVAGNIAHYEYFDSTNITNRSANVFLSLPVVQEQPLGKQFRLWLPLNERSKRSVSSRKTRDTWSVIEKPPNHHRRW